MPNMPRIKHILWGELTYKDGFKNEEPDIHDDRVCLTSSVMLHKKFSPADFELLLTPLIDEAPNTAQIRCALANIELDEANQIVSQKILHFRTPELLCHTDYRCDVLYQKKSILPASLSMLDGQDFIITTPPARQDPQPLNIALGGDQERFEQLGVFGRLLGLNNERQTKKIYEHIEKQPKPYDVILHLGDLYNGEFYFSFSNLFRHNRHVFEPHVKSEEAFSAHLRHDFFKPSKLAFARIGAGFYPLIDDHDTGKNSRKAITTQDERIVQQHMERAFHRHTLLPQFTTQTTDGYGKVTTKHGRLGPYFKIRIGQHEIFMPHNRYTQTDDAPADAFLLGEEQWQWLEASLNDSKASNKILLSPLPLVMGKNPAEDYRGHHEEWSRLLQLCRHHQIATILTADSHNFSHSEIWVRCFPDDEPWVVNHYLVGTLGGSSQKISAAELDSINQPNRMPLLPEDAEFDRELYRGSRVLAYFAPGKKYALLPLKNELGITTSSEWSTNWHKDVHGYANLIFNPLVSPNANAQLAQDTSSFQVNSRFFACRKRHQINDEARLSQQYSIHLS